MSDLRRVLPHNLDFERSVLGGVLLQPKAFVDVGPIVEARDFYHPVHAAIFQAMCDLDAASKPIDQNTVAEQMRASDSYEKLRAFRGEAYFSELTTAVVTVENIAFHARNVRGLAVIRGTIEAAQEIAAKGYHQTALDIETYRAEVEQAMLSALMRADTGRGPVQLRCGLKGLVTSMEDRYNNPSGMAGISTGWGALDLYLRGLRRGALYVVAARPKTGKTSFACSLALNVGLSKTAPIPVLFFSLEMEGVNVERGGELLERMVQIQAEIDGVRMTSGVLTPGERLRQLRVHGQIDTAKIYVDDKPAQTLAEVRSKARRWRMTHATGDVLVIVDYLQLMRHPPAQGRNGNREREVAEIAEGLKALAKDLSCPVIALSQLNRSVEARADKRPMASDLRESGAIEQAADAVLLLYREEIHKPTTENQGIAEVIVSVQRNGPTGTARLRFVKEMTRFESVRGEG